MARPLRIDVRGGWYHVTSRGHNREALFLDGGDRAHLLELLEAATTRYGVEVHAYVLMPNHYHLLLRTPDANCSRAMQWINQSYATWWNRRHGRTGHVYEGRFKAILVEEGGWVLAVSQYLHFNPVAVRRLGWGKSQRAAEAQGLAVASPEQVALRVATLRNYVWSSYRAYAGYTEIPPWLSTKDVLSRVKGGRAGYRAVTEERLRQGRDEPVWSKVKWGAMLGSARFTEYLHKGLKVNAETSGKRQLRTRVNWSDVVRAVEDLKGESWDAFCNRHGDWGRDLVLTIARRHTGLTHGELATAAGGMAYATVAMSVRRMEERLKRDATLQSVRAAATNLLNIQT